MVSIQSHQNASSHWASAIPERPSRLHLYRDRTVGGYVASEQPLRSQSPDLQPEFDGQAVPAVICRAFIAQYGGEIR